MKIHLTILLTSFLGACTTPELEYSAPLSEQPLPTIGGNLSYVRHPSHIKRYTVGRYAEPDSPRVFHEAHSLYRIEKDPRWNFVATYPTHMKTAEISRGHNQQEIEQIRRELRRTREVSRAVVHSKTQMSKQIERMNTALEQAQKFAEKNKELTEKKRQQEPQEKPNHSN